MNPKWRLLEFEPCADYLIAIKLSAKHKTSLSLTLIYRMVKFIAISHKVVGEDWVS